MADERLVDVIAFQIQTSGSAKIRTGERRSDAAARKLLRAGADLVGCTVSIRKIDNGVEATIKE